MLHKQIGIFSLSQSSETFEPSLTAFFSLCGRSFSADRMNVSSVYTSCEEVRLMLTFSGSRKTQSIHVRGRRIPLRFIEGEGGPNGTFLKTRTHVIMRRMDAQHTKQVTNKLAYHFVWYPNIARRF
jgi:hypothetical protein